MQPIIPFVHTTLHNVQRISVHEANLPIVDAELERDPAKYGNIIASYIKDTNLTIIRSHEAQSIEDFGFTVDYEAGGGPIKTSKRISRIMRERRFFIHDMPSLNVVVAKMTNPFAKLGYDGMSFISRDVLLKVTQESPYLRLLAEVDKDRAFELKNDLLTSSRVDLTVVNGSGQIKGHALVVNGDEWNELIREHLDDLDEDSIRHHLNNPGILTDPINVKAGVTYSGTFIDVDPVHGHDRGNMDIQSLINLSPAIWTAIGPTLDLINEDNAAIFKALESGMIPVGGRFSYLDDDEESLTKDYPLLLAKAYGMRPDAFPAIGNMVLSARQTQLRSMYKRFRFYIPNLNRRYIATDFGVVGDRAVHTDATSIFVNPITFSLHLAGILGGADMDDAVMCLPFIDKAKGREGERSLLIWRTPNQTGEYFVFHNYTDSGDGLHIPYPLIEMDSSKLPTRIDLQDQKFPDVPPAAPPKDLAMAFRQLLANQGGIGAYANYIMLAYASDFNQLPQLPYSFESIIDSVVKDGRPIGHAIEAVQKLVERLVVTRKIPRCLLPRLAEWQRDKATVCDLHTLDVLQDKLQAIYEEFAHAKQAYGRERYGQLPKASADEMQLGRDAYAWFFSMTRQRTGKRVDPETGAVSEVKLPPMLKHRLNPDTGESEWVPDWTRIGETFQARLDKLPIEKRRVILLAMYRYAVVTGKSELPLFTTATGHEFIRTLWEVHMIEPLKRQHVQLTAKYSWFNLYLHKHTAENMKDVPADVKADYIAKTERVAQAIQGEAITIQDRRIIARGTCIGYVPKDDAELWIDGQYDVYAAEADLDEGQIHMRVFLAQRPDHLIANLDMSAWYEQLKDKTLYVQPEEQPVETETVEA